MKRIFQFSIMAAFLFLMLFYFQLNIATAHELDAEGAITGTLHIDPNDAPLAGGASQLDFSFSDKEGEFKAADCDCVLKITEGEKELINTNILTDKDIVLNDTGFSFPYVFPEKGDYTITLNGNAGPEEDDKIDFSYNVNVDLTVGETESLGYKVKSLFRGHALHIVLFGGAILISIIVILTD